MPHLFLAFLTLAIFAGSSYGDPKFFSARYSKSTSVVLELNQTQDNILAVGPPQNADEATISFRWHDLSGHPACHDEPTPANKAEAQSLNVPIYHLDKHAGSDHFHVCCRSDTELLADIRTKRIRNAKKKLIEDIKRLQAVTTALGDLPGDADLLQEKSEIEAAIIQDKKDARITP